MQNVFVGQEVQLGTPTVKWMLQTIKKWAVKKCLGCLHIREMWMSRILRGAKYSHAWRRTESDEEFCGHIETAKNQYLERDWIIPQVTDRIIIDLNPDNGREQCYQLLEWLWEQWIFWWLQ
jgi:hypothetical protein